MHNLHKKHEKTTDSKNNVLEDQENSLSERKNNLWAVKTSDGLLSETENLTYRGVIKRDEHWIEKP